MSCDRKLNVINKMCFERGLNTIFLLQKKNLSENIVEDRTKNVVCHCLFVSFERERSIYF